MYFATAGSTMPWLRPEQTRSRIAVKKSTCIKYSKILLGTSQAENLALISIPASDRASKNIHTLSFRTNRLTQLARKLT